MSFSYELKIEIAGNRAMRARCKKAQAYGLFLFSRSFSAESVLLHTENESVFELYCGYVRDFAGKNAALRTSGETYGGRTLFTAAVAGREERERLLGAFGHDGGINRGVFPSPEGLHAFLAGAYLACGSVTDPEKSYHLEFAVRDSVLRDELFELLDGAIPGARRSTRRGLQLVYYKEYSQIEDLLTLMGASKSCLKMIDVEMIKTVRNQANRATNCETANIDKQVNASTAQVADIRFLLDSGEGLALPEPLRRAALHRLENPDMSLRELAATMPEPISRSGMFHRLDKLSKIAEELRRKDSG